MANCSGGFSATAYLGQPDVHGLALTGKIFDMAVAEGVFDRPLSSQK